MAGGRVAFFCLKLAPYMYFSRDYPRLGLLPEDHQRRIIEDWTLGPVTGSETSVSVESRVENRDRRLQICEL